MAYVSSSHTSRDLLGTVLAALKKAGNAIFNFLADLTTAQARLDQIEALQRLSDEELERRYRIKRSEIVQFVFRDKMMF